MAVADTDIGSARHAARRAAAATPAQAPTGPILAADGTPLRTRLRQAQFRGKLRAFGLAAPLLAFVIAAFIIPVIVFLLRGFQDHEYAEYMPLSTEALSDWDGVSEPTEEMFAALVADLAAVRDHPDRPIGKVGNRVNREWAGASSLFKSGARAAGDMQAPFREALVAHDADWGKLEVWQAIRVSSRAWTMAYVAAALDHRQLADGSFEAQPEDRRIHVTLFLRTLEISFTVTLLTLLLGYPVAWLMANLPLRTSNLILILVLLPFWTSILVRTTAWIALLQGQGVLNDLMVFTGLNQAVLQVMLIFNDYSELSLTSLCGTDVNAVIAQGAAAISAFEARAAADLSTCAATLRDIAATSGVDAAVARATEMMQAATTGGGFGDERFSMIYNKIGTLIAMTHILLPFMILPLYSVMKTIPPSYLRAAKSLGATNWTAFWRVYFPNTVPGIGAGALLVFILAIGYYITPALVGGEDGQMISNFIDFHMRKSLNWPLAAALGGVLLVFVLFLYWLYDRIVGIDNMKLG